MSPAKGGPWSVEGCSRPVRLTVHVAGAFETGQCDKVRTKLWVTIEDVGAAGTSATDSARIISILLVAAWTDFPPPAIMEMIAVAETGSAAAAIVAVTVVATGLVAAAAATVAAATGLAVAAHVAADRAAVAALAEVAASIACLRRWSAPARAR